MTIKKIKLPSNPYSQLLVHNVASTFLGKRRDWYGVRIFFLVLKLDSEAAVVIRMLIRSRAIKEAEKSQKCRGREAQAWNWKSVEVWKEGQRCSARDKSRGSEELSHWGSFAALVLVDVVVTF